MADKKTTASKKNSSKKATKKETKKVSTTTSAPKMLPGVIELFKESWQLTVANSFRLFLVWLGTTITSFIVMAIVNGVTLAKLFQSGVITQLMTNSEAISQELVMSLATKLGVSLSVTMLLLILLSQFSAIVALLIFGSEKRQSWSELFSKAGTALLPVVGLQILVGLISTGGMVLLIVPGIIISFFLSFAMTDLVLSKRSVIGAMKRSTALVKNYFGAVIIRMISYAAAYLVIFSLIPQAFMQIAPDFAIAFNFLVLFPLGLLFGWFTSAFMVTLYKQLEDRVPAKTTGLLGLFSILAVLGWLIIIAGTYFGVKAFHNFSKTDAFAEIQRNMMEPEESMTNKMMMDEAYRQQMMGPEAGEGAIDYTMMMEDLSDEEREMLESFMEQNPEMVEQMMAL